MRINGHGHLLPYPHEIPNFMKEKALFWVSADKKMMCQGTWRRPITEDSFFLDGKLAWLEKNQIDREVIITLSQLYCNGYHRSDAHDVIRFQNDYHAYIQQEHGQKFECGFVIQPLFIEDALLEIERCVHSLGLKVLCLPSHYLDADRNWKVIANEDVSPIFQLANEYKLAIEIHPYNAEEMVLLQDQFWRFHLIWMCAQTADAYHFYSLLDFANRFPFVRPCFAHGNLFGQVGYGRRVQGFNGRPDLFNDAVHPQATLKHQNIFFDSIVHDVLSFELLIKRSGVQQVIAGLDDPYPLGEVDFVVDSYPGRVIDLGVENGIITSSERDQIWNENVMRWIHG